MDAEIHLAAESNGTASKEGNKASNQQKAKATIFLRHCLHEDLKNGYLTVRYPLVLWNYLKERYEHQKSIILPKALTVAAYNFSVFIIISQLDLCGRKCNQWLHVRK